MGYQPKEDNDLAVSLGGAVLAMREGGIRGGAVSEPETLPRLHPMGINSDGSEGADGFVPEGRAGGDEGHGMDAAHARAGVIQGQLTHGASEARGGHYHCMAEGCHYFTRDGANMKRHAGKKHYHSLGSSDGRGSSGGSPSSGGMGSSGGRGSSPAHGQLGGTMARIRQRFINAETEGGMDTSAHYMGSSYVSGDARK